MSPSKQSRRTGSRKHLPGRKHSSDTSTLPEYIPSPGWNHFGRHSHSGRRSDVDQQVQHQAGDDKVAVDIAAWDKPPDYPDSAEEADEDTDDSDTIPHHRHHHPTPPTSFSPRAHTTSPRRSKFLPQPPLTPTHKRGQSSQSHLLRPSRSILHHKPRQASERLLLSPANPVPDLADPYLDSLLERSVHALEMSNTLLQSSISTQTSLSTVLAAGDLGSSLPETMLETRALSLRSRIQHDWVARSAWADDLEEISRDVEGLFGGSGTAMTASAVPTPSTMTEAGSVSDDKEGVGMGMIIKRSSSHRSGASGMSCSLPSTSTLSPDPMTWNRKRPSLDLEEVATDNNFTTPGLHFARQSRDNLVSPPPRPITQYTPSIQVSDEIVLPSTIGMRSQPSIYQSSPQWKSVSEFASSSTTSLLTVPSFPAPLLPPKLTDKLLEPSTPAYTMLSSFVNRQPSSSSPNTPSTSFTTSFMETIRRTSNQSNRRSASTPPASSLRDRCTHTIISQRPMTPPTEESSSSESCMANRTVQCLRKILDDQPPNPTVRTAELGLSGDRLKVPKFMPRTPAPLPEASTSNATASISRLFTKGTHSSSTRAPSPPRLSAMKHSRNNSSASATPTSAAHLPLPPVVDPSSPTPTTLNVPEMVSKVLNGRNGAASSSSSGRSTPNKRISFAELPESYASTRPGGAGSSKFKEKHSRKKRKGDASSSDSGLGFRTARWWLGGGGDTGVSAPRYEERMEERIARNWGGRMGLFSSGLEDWAA